jgi:predicted DNA-binding transcriptional regulator AlpA
MKEEPQSLFAFEQYETQLGKHTPIVAAMRSSQRKQLRDAGSRVDRTDRIMRRREVEAVTGFSRSTLYRQIKADAFPRPIRLSANTVGFLASEVFAWLNNRVAARQRELTESSDTSIDAAKDK